MSLSGGASRKSNESVSRWVGWPTMVVFQGRVIWAATVPCHVLAERVNSEGGTVDLPAADATPRIQLDLHPLLSLLSLVAREKCSILFREGPIWMG